MHFAVHYVGNWDTILRKTDKMIAVIQLSLLWGRQTLIYVSYDNLGTKPKCSEGTQF